jgi:hypothetical protein
MIKLILFFIYTISATCFANSKINFDSALNIDKWISINGQKLDVNNYNLVMPKFKFSCNHVRYRMNEADALDNEVLEASRGLSQIGYNERYKLNTTGVSIYKNIVANRQRRFFEPIFEVELELKRTNNTYFIINTPFSMDHISIDNPTDKAMVKKINGQPVIKLELSYLDVCLGYKINVATARCMNLLNKDCRDGEHYRVNTKDLMFIWLSKYAEINN